MALKGQIILKKLVQINTVCNTSTGKLMKDIQREADRLGYETLSVVGRRKPFADLRCEKIGNAISFWSHVIITTVFDRQGYGSYFMTKKIVKRLREEKPDIIHLHNLHGYYLNLPVLFHYLSNEYKGKVFWTFHDCWPFTGHCAYFSAMGCDKWKKECSFCPNKKEYPISLFLDASKKNYQDKREIFTSLKDLTIITPSEWMAGLVKESFLQDYPVKVVNNGIDLKTFTYTDSEYQVFDKYGIDRKKKILLGVASVWDKRKGLDDFLALSKVLPSKYHILLVGVSKAQKRKLPHNITGILRTDSKEELARIYSASHIFVNPSLEESFSLVTVEAMACGTPVIVLDTSAVGELVSKESGSVLTNHKPTDYLKAIKEIESKELSREKIAESVQKYDAEVYAKKVIGLYEQM